MLDLLASALGSVFSSRRMAERKTSRLRKKSIVASTLRVVEGAHPPLSARWSPGYATLSNGLLDFGFTQVDVVDVDTDSSRRPSMKETWWVDPDATIVRLNTEAAVLEWAVSRSQLDWALGILTGTAPR